MNKACAFLAGAFVLASSVVSAQTYPSRHINLIIPFAAGGSNDIVGRAIGKKLSEAWGQPVVIENRAGAGGTIGAAVVAAAPSDGYTSVSYTHLRAHETDSYLVCRLLLEKKK